MSQKSQQFETPERSEIPGLTREHIGEMEASSEDEFWIRAGMPHLILRCSGRRSGRRLKVALPYWNDAAGLPIVVASYSGAPKHPGWYHNLADRRANPEVLVRQQRTSFWASAEILDGDEHAAIWQALVVDRPFYQDYQDECERRIPLVRLLETRGETRDV